MEALLHGSLVVVCGKVKLTNDAAPWYTELHASHNVSFVIQKVFCPYSGKLSVPRVESFLSLGFKVFLDSVCRKVKLKNDAAPEPHASHYGSFFSYHP